MDVGNLVNHVNIHVLVSSISHRCLKSSSSLACKWGVCWSCGLQKNMLVVWGDVHPSHGIVSSLTINLTVCKKKEVFTHPRDHLSFNHWLTTSRKCVAHPSYRTISSSVTDWWFAKKVMFTNPTKSSLLRSLILSNHLFFTCLLASFNMSIFWSHLNSRSVGIFGIYFYICIIIIFLLDLVFYYN